ncbi:MAG: YceI family protein [Glaciecola sp.]
MSTKLVPNMLMSFWFLVVMSMSGSIQAKTIDTSSNNSKVSFSGEHAGMKFDGVFENWQATLVLPPSADASINAVFSMQSAKTGDSIYDSTLPETDWFDAEKHPRGTFVSDEIVKTPAGYKVSGNLTLKGITNPVSFLLQDTGKTLNATFTINRLNYQIGTESDPQAEWVSQNITLSLTIIQTQN